MLCRNVPNARTRKKESERECVYLGFLMSCLKTLGSAKVHMYQQIKKDSWLSAEKPRQTHKAGTQIQIWKRESCSDSNIFECSWMHMLYYTKYPVGGWKFCSPFLVRSHLRGYCSQTFHAQSVFMDGDLRLWIWTESVEQKPLDPIDVYIFYPHLPTQQVRKNPTSWRWVLGPSTLPWFKLPEYWLIAPQILKEAMFVFRWNLAIWKIIGILGIWMSKVTQTT